MRRRDGVATIYGWVAIAFAGLIVLQVFFAGLGIFGAEGFGLHRTFGNLLHGLTVILLVLAVLGPATQRDIGMAGGLLVLATVQIGIVDAQGSAPALAALHPVLALLMLGLAVHMGINALRGHRAAAL